MVPRGDGRHDEQAAICEDVWAPVAPSTHGAFLANRAQPAGCVTLSVTLVGVSNTVQIVQPPDEKWLYSTVQHHPTA